MVPAHGARAPYDPVDVPASHRAESCVEVIGHQRSLQHAHVRRQDAVQPLLQPIHHHVRIRPEVDDLTGGVHAGVRTSGRGRAEVGLQNGVNRLLQDALHGAALGLDLPTEETGAVVFELEDQGAHGGSGVFRMAGDQNRLLMVLLLLTTALSTSRVATAPMAT